MACPLGLVQEQPPGQMGPGSQQLRSEVQMGCFAGLGGFSKQMTNPIKAHISAKAGEAN